MTAQDQNTSLAQLLDDNGISLAAIRDEHHPGFALQKARLIGLLKSGQITEKRVKALAKVLPGANEALRGVSSDAKESQVALIESLKSSHASAYSVIEKIVEQATSDELRLEALQTVERIAGSNDATHTQIAASNNTTFKYVAGGILAGLVLVAGGAAAKALSRR
ncbi:hypothetical protein [Stenotrophomonas mori]|uniref:DUF883 domain-containing protein n=1 Tax=Stenotrophomonas mori TaxID=2871096 RepID=A0ABT0SKD5_9GAMM|nr:hypothetical protein [Stenotrophomonas mori]MCL7715802.1 hypothetical protein [Stenotrophomonas mori]